MQKIKKQGHRRWSNTTVTCIYTVMGHIPEGRDEVEKRRHREKPALIATHSYRNLRQFSNHDEAEGGEGAKLEVGKNEPAHAAAPSQSCRFSIHESNPCCTVEVVRGE